MFSKNFFVGILIILIMSLAGISIKYNNLKDGRGIENIQATYHTLLTLNSLSSLPFKESALLPTVNFSGENNKNIPWAAAVKTVDGNYVYTSFPSLGFVAPYLALRIVGAELNIKNLFIFNSILGIATCILFFSALYLLACNAEASNAGRVISAVAGSSVAIFSCESLVSSGLIYWPQSLSQLCFSLILLLFTLKRNKTRNTITDVLLFLSLLAFPMIEWTGYVFNGLLFIYCIVARFDGWKKIATLCLIASAIAIIIFALQIAAVVSITDFIQTSLARFGARSVEKASFALLAKGYWISFGTYLLFLIPALLSLKESKDRFLIIICILPLLENLLLANHAMLFTFDRWKLAFLIGVGISLAVQGAFGKHILLYTLVLFSALFGIYQYQEKIKLFSPWQSANVKNMQLVEATAQATNIKCASFYSDVRVRGYSPLLFMRGIHEGLPASPDAELTNNTSICSVVILHGQMPTPDMPELTSIEIWNRGNNSPVIVK